MKKLLPLLVVLALLVGVILFFRGNGSKYSPATVWEQGTEIRTDAVSLFDEFMQDETGANEKYLNKVTEVSGVVSTVRTDQGGQSVVLRTNDPTSGVRCRLDRKPGQDGKNYEVGQTVTFKCICSGYVRDVEMVQCVEK
ncbi:MAG: hypothetical protein IPM82_16185 [Saprospiraceae bacterium]|nr:hypothetical protein [Saprospiraceae bacterium]